MVPDLDVTESKKKIAGSLVACGVAGIRVEDKSRLSGRSPVVYSRLRFAWHPCQGSARGEMKQSGPSTKSFP